MCVQNLQTLPTMGEHLCCQSDQVGDSAFPRMDSRGRCWLVCQGIGSKIAPGNAAVTYLSEDPSTSRRVWDLQHRWLSHIHCLFLFAVEQGHVWGFGPRCFWHLNSCLGYTSRHTMFLNHRKGIRTGCYPPGHFWVIMSPSSQGVLCVFLGNHVLSPPLAGECTGSGPGCLGSDARSVTVSKLFSLFVP